MKTASIYKRPNKGYVIFSLSKTTTGLLIASEPFITIPEDKADVDLMVNQIKSALCNDHSKEISNPVNWSEFNRIFLQKIGLKSFKELENPRSKYVLISEKEGKIVFTPTRPAEKPDKGFLHKDENEAVIVPITALNQDIVTAYELALSKCG